MGTVIEVDGFTDADDAELDPIEIPVPWRDGDRKLHTETLWARPRIPLGFLLQIEAADPRGIGLLATALLKDDHERDKDDEPVAGTSSAERWEALTLDPEREIPGQAVRNILRGLYVEYTNRRNPAGAPKRPTNSSGPSSGRSSQTGRSSTAARRGKASTSSPSRQMSG